MLGGKINRVMAYFVSEVGEFMASKIALLNPLTLD